MNMISRLNLHEHLLLLVLLLSSPTLLAEVTHTPQIIDSLSAKRQQITEKIDSLDLVKQECKRKALPVAELEQLQTSLRDSIHQIQDVLQKAAKVVSGPKVRSARPVKHFFTYPENLFDWIIIIVGIIATFSGLLLIAGIIKKVASAPKRSRPKKTVPHSPASPPNTDNKLKPGAEFPQYSAAGIKTSLSSPAPYRETPAQQVDTATILSLRQRIRIQPLSEPDEPLKLQLPPAETQPARVTPNIPQQDNGLSTEEKVVAAAKNGADIATISRTFHLSADHVTLILKIAKNK